MNPDPPLDIETLSRFVQKCGYMRKRRATWLQRLAYRMAVELLAIKTQQAVSGGAEPEGKWTKKVTK